MSGNARLSDLYVSATRWNAGSMALQKHNNKQAGWKSAEKIVRASNALFRVHRHKKNDGVFSRPSEDKSLKCLRIRI